jgi:putative effector of murein hydrolase
MLANPTMIAMAVVGLFLLAFGVSHETYMAGAAPIHLLLGPAVVLLAVPLLRQAALIRSSQMLVVCAVLVGAASGLAAALGIAELLGSLPSFTAALVVMTGLVGAVAGPWVARLAGVRDDRAVGLALGIASHGPGTARALRISPVAGAFAGLGMGIGSIVTAGLLGLLSILIG